MSDLIGQTLGHYRIVEKIGEGGMGEVYRTRDERLDRDVAVKVLPEAVAEDPQRLARFEREAKLLASLSHQNVATLHGLEEHEGQRFLVMELAEGETLAERIKRGPILIDDALDYALQIAEGLEAAHEQGTIHRDLKPANVMVSTEGKVKVLDFGLAKAWLPEDGDADLTHSPTLTGQMTAAGVILGTASYMSPEQARGKPVDKRADIWSFGVLLWEMLTGQSLFTGETVTDVIAAVVTKEPDLDALPAQTPRAVRQLVSRCLRKDQRTRLPDIGAARLELQDVLAGTTAEVEEAVVDVEATRRERLSRKRERRAWAAVVALVLVGLAVVLLQRLAQAPETPSVAHFVLEEAEDLTFTPIDFNPLAVSPDGRFITFLGSSSGRTERLWIRSLDEPEVRALPGTEGALGRFWSPDSTSIAFSAEGELRKLHLASGTVQRICAIPQPGFSGGTWNTEGTIVFSAGGMDSRLYAVEAAGGEPRLLTSHDTSRGETDHWNPQFLPDGRHILFVVNSGEEEHAGLHVISFEDPSQRRRVLSDQTLFFYAEPGHLLFVRDGLLLAQRFDVEQLAVEGEAIPIASAVGEVYFAGSWGQFSVSETGLVAWVSARTELQLEWLDRTGNRLGTLGEPGRYGQIALSPDETRVAVEISDGDGRFDLWVMDVARGIASRVTSNPGDERDPVWSPDGQELIFDTAGGGGDLIRIELTGDKSASPLLEGSRRHIAEFWMRDGESLLFVTDAEGRRTLSALSLDGDEPAELLIESEFGLDEPQVSPDGRWLAYISTESGRFDVYVEPFRRRGERVRVSANGGGQPKWRGDGKELFYLTLGGALMAVDVREGTTGPDVGIPTTLIPAHVLRSVVIGQDLDDYAVSADGQRFLVKRPATLDGKQQIHVLMNWPSLVEQTESGQ
jgi:Tol biopolymer transport system component